MNIQKAYKLLRNRLLSAEEYHALYDEIVEEKLSELDPEFMNAIKLEYENSKIPRWYS